MRCKIEKTSAFAAGCGAKITETKPEDDDIDVVDTARSVRKTPEKKRRMRPAPAETVPDEEVWKPRSAETTVNVTEDQE